MAHRVPTEKEFSLIRVLIALAWADGKISLEEQNYLKDFFFKFDFTGEEWAKIEMYLDEPVPPEEAETLIQEYVQTIGGRAERDMVIASLKGLMSVDGVSSPEEQSFLERFVTIFQETGPATALIGRIKGLFQETVFKAALPSNRKGELKDFINNRILFKVRRRLEREKLSIEDNPEALAYASLFGGLLGHVAAVHEGVSEDEIAVLKEKLQASGSFDAEAIELIASVIQGVGSEGFDVFRMTREFYGKSTGEQRKQLLDALFAVAGADNDLAYVEVEAVRDIAYGLRFSHRAFIDAKSRYIKQSKEKSES